MKSPTLQELPPPPNGKTGWPWTEAGPQPEMDMSAVDWPKITIVTPSYNQGQFLEETLRSVLLQGYPNLEYFVIDGGSTDESAAIIKKYALWIDYWVSEKDRGQTHAINKGYERATGDVINWLNSDDTYPPGSLLKVGQVFATHPNLAMCFGDSVAIDADSVYLRTKKMNKFRRESLLLQHQMSQPSVFLSMDVVRELGLLDESLHYVMDGAYFLRVWYSYSDERILYWPEAFSNTRIWEEAKTSSGVSKITSEWREMLDGFFATYGDAFADSEGMKRKAVASSYRRQAYLQVLAGQKWQAQMSAFRAAAVYPGLGARIRYFGRLSFAIWLGRSRMRRLSGILAGGG